MRTKTQLFMQIYYTVMACLNPAYSIFLISYRWCRRVSWWKICTKEVREEEEEKEILIGLGKP